MAVGADIGKGPHMGAGVDGGLIALGGVDHRAHPHGAVGEHGVGADLTVFSNHCVSPQDGAPGSSSVPAPTVTPASTYTAEGSIISTPAASRAARFAPERLAPWQAPRISQNRSGQNQRFCGVHTHYNRLAEILKGYFDIWPDFFHPDKSRGTFPGKAGEKDNGPSAKGGRSVRKRHFAAG